MIKYINYYDKNKTSIVEYLNIINIHEDLIWPEIWNVFNLLEIEIEELRDKLTESSGEIEIRNIKIEELKEDLEYNKKYYESELAKIKQ